MSNEAHQSEVTVQHHMQSAAWIKWSIFLANPMIMGIILNSHLQYIVCNACSRNDDNNNNDWNWLNFFFVSMFISSLLPVCMSSSTMNKCSWWLQYYYLTFTHAALHSIIWKLNVISVYLCLLPSFVVRLTNFVFSFRIYRCTFSN